MMKFSIRWSSLSLLAFPVLGLTAFWLSDAGTSVLLLAILATIVHVGFKIAACYRDVQSEILRLDQCVLEVGKQVLELSKSQVANMEVDLEVQKQMTDTQLAIMKQQADLLDLTTKKTDVDLALIEAFTMEHLGRKFYESVNKFKESRGIATEPIPDDAPE